jgi:arylsulfatase A-like enzyme
LYKLAVPPSRASVLTGTYSHINGVIGNAEGADNIERINSKLPTYPQVLQKNGYRTAMIEKWHLSHDPAGFDYSCILPGQGLYFDPTFIENGREKQFKGYCTDITTDIALDWPRNDQEHRLSRAEQAPFLAMFLRRSGASAVCEIRAGAGETGVAARLSNLGRFL